MVVKDVGRVGVYSCEHLYARMCERANPTTGPVLTELAGSGVYLPPVRKFSTVEQAQTYASSVIVSTRNLWPNMAGVKVRERKGDRAAHWEAPNTIAVPTTMLDEHVLLHELAHHVSFHNGTGGQKAHGKEFRTTLCTLHTTAIGPVGGWALSVVFDMFLPPENFREEGK